MQQHSPMVREELLRIYGEYCPSKGSAEVEAILAKFAGREGILLRKVRAKYLTNPQTPTHDG
jgi:hypothetical protein